MKSSRKIYAMNLFSNLIFYAPVALLVRTNRGISLSQFFVLQAILSVTCMVFEFPLGVLTDKIGLKKSIVLAQFTMLTARIILLISNNFMLFAVEALLEGIAFALNSGTISAYIYKLFGDDNYSNNISKFYNFGTIAFIISTVMFPFINSRWNINALIWVTIIANTVATIISIFYSRYRQLE
ncbi:MAG: MFS transporter [Finegoldia magna]|nr:MFS transporter [Finegoldia magna]MDU1009864.1 MFS transporter [Finegoldia magna]MDU1086605.1 MFS transporter [Finegoldia magna]MDU7891100.1 MFS transporter [Finegoldia magna]MDU7925760.1 MFS transporter [Finegoldia magna]